MKNSDREQYVNDLWELHHLGGLTISEYATFMARDCATAFYAGADLATLLTACSTVETYLRSEGNSAKSYSTFNDLIDQSGLSVELISDLHEIRKYRNRWVHVNEPDNDIILLDQPELVEAEIEKFAILALKSMVRTLCSNQWV